MVQQIKQRHLDFLQDVKEAFEANEGLYTYRDDDETLIALRYGMDRDCVLIYELDGCIANFVQQIDPKPSPRKEVMIFSHDMEKQLKVNDHKGGWESEHSETLVQEIKKNITQLITYLLDDDKDKREITMRCANIANYAMMIADNEGERL